MLFVEKVAGLLNELRKNEPQAWQIFVGKKKAKKTDKDEVQKITRPYLEEARKAKESMAVDVALFGRMTTSDLIANVDASCQVAHAISTHEALIESDYFTAVDELDRSGAGFVSDSEAMTFFNAAVYYKYVNVDARAFLTTIGDQGAAHAKKVPAVLLQAAALSSPTGKQNSFAAHSVPELILVEASHVRQPISYANAFLQPIRGDDLMRESVGALSEYCGSVARAFAPQDTQRFLLTAGRAAGVPFNLDAVKVETLAELVARVENAWTPDLQPV
jgi:CRISPR system Cascade subunit CasC